MNGFVFALLGGAVGIGIMLTMAGCRGVAVLAQHRPLRAKIVLSFDRLLLRAALSAGFALIALWLSHWIVFAVVAAGIGWWSPTYLDSRGRHARELALVEAIASWTEQIRDTLAASNGLEHALGATATLAPAPIAAAVERLAARFDYERLPDALRRFADEVDHPMADFVVAALIIATEKEARDLGALLSQLADSARDEARMRTRVWVGRARSRSAVRIIVGVVLAFIVGLLLFNRSYLEPYDSAGGQAILCAIVAMFAASFVAMERMGRIAMPERFVARRLSSTSAIEGATR